MTILYHGPNPQVVGRTKKYKVKWDSGEWRAALEWDVPGGTGVRILLATEHHPVLVSMVNQVKGESQSADGGSFYINEFNQVIVPGGNPVRYYLAGEYPTPLRFWWNGEIISGDARGFDGKRLKAGDAWTGPLVGIPYVLSADGRDIYFTYEVAPGATRKVYLSGVATDPEPTIDLVRTIIGSRGGRFYVNEFRHIFRPAVTDEFATYVGHLSPSLPWFTKPHSGKV
jgi:hypothetical protein